MLDGMIRIYKKTKAKRLKLPKAGIVNSEFPKAFLEGLNADTKRANTAIKSFISAAMPISMAIWYR